MTEKIHLSNNVAAGSTSQQHYQRIFASCRICGFAFYGFGLLALVAGVIAIVNPLLFKLPPGAWQFVIPASVIAVTLCAVLGGLLLRTASSGQSGIRTGDAGRLDTALSQMANYWGIASGILVALLTVLAFGFIYYVL